MLPTTVIVLNCESELQWNSQDWRPDFHAANPTFPRWFADHRQDLTLQLKDISIPVLLLWGDADPISQVAVGQRLASLLARSTLHVIQGANRLQCPAFSAARAGWRRTIA